MLDSDHMKLAAVLFGNYLNKMVDLMINLSWFSAALFHLCPFLSLTSFIHFFTLLIFLLITHTSSTELFYFLLLHWLP